MAIIHHATEPVRLHCLRQDDIRGVKSDRDTCHSQVWCAWIVIATN